MIIEIKNTEFYLFGSYLKTPNFKDIDVLVVIPDVCDIEGANEYIKLLKEKHACSIVHTHLYIKSEYLNSQNKFCYKNVNHQISLEEFSNLFHIKPNPSNKKADL
jgi:hypothetical protein